MSGDDYYYHLLSKHARDGAHEEAAALLSVVSPCDLPATAKWTALHLAAHHGHIRVLRLFIHFLLAIGGDPPGSASGVNVRDHRGRTALHLASCAGHVRAVRLLTLAGADVRARDHGRLDHDSHTDGARGEIPVVAAAARGRADVVAVLLPYCDRSVGPEVLGAALGRSACLNTANVVLRRWPRAARDRAAMSAALLSLCSKKADAPTPPLAVAKRLFELNADVDAQDDLGWTPLHHASYCGRLELVRFLLVDCKTNAVNTANAEDQTPLVLTCRKGKDECRYRIIRLLLRHGANPSAADMWSDESPLNRIGRQVEVKLMRALADAGRRVSDLSSDESAILAAATSGSCAVLKWYAKHGYDFTSRALLRGRFTLFACAAYRSQLSSMKTLVKLGADPSLLDKWGCSALHYFIIGLDDGTIEAYDPDLCRDIISFLVQSCGLDPDLAMSSTNRHLTALYIAARYGHVEATRALVHCGATVDAALPSGK
jgi:ankyrin repeat protein